MSAFYEELSKSKIVSDETENKQSRANVDKWIFILLLVMLGTVPLIVFANVEEVISPLISSNDLLSSGAKGDIFTHYKSILLILFTIILSVMLLIKVYFMNGSIRKTFLNYILGIFALVIVITTIASPNITIALNGQYNRSDGAITWLCYITLLFIILNIEMPKNTIRYIMYTLLPFVYINFYLITMNFWDKDLLQNSGVQKFVSIFLIEGASISGDSQLVGTLNQWNYMSGMFAIITIMYLAWAITSKKIITIFIGIITAVISMSIVFMSVSTSGFITVIVMITIIIFTGFIYLDKKVVSVVLVSFFVIVTPIFNLLAEKDSKVWEESFGFFINKNPYIEEVGKISLKSNVAFASDQVIKLPVLPERGISAGTGRLYIWEKTFDLIQERPILGYGKDTIIYNFPHYNIDARSGLRDENTITDKTHNEYMGILYGFGVLGLLSFLIIAGKLFINFWRSLKKRNSDIYILSSAGCAYFMQLLFNDSLPGISIVMFIIIGMSLTLEIKYREIDCHGRNSRVSQNN